MGGVLRGDSEDASMHASPYVRTDSDMYESMSNCDRALVRSLNTDARKDKLLS